MHSVNADAGSSRMKVLRRSLNYQVCSWKH